MVTLTLGARDLANVRFAFSPLWECVAAFRVWRDPARHALHAPWAAGVTAAVSGVDWSLLDTTVRPPSGALPDFLAPPPAIPLARFDEEIAALQRTSADVVQAEVEAAYPSGVPTHLAQALRNGDAFLEAVTRLLEQFWRRAVAPVWPRIVARLEAEVIYRSRAVALGGAPALLDALHSAVRYAGDARRGTLRIRAREQYARTSRGAGLLLVPSVFAWPDVFAAVRPPWRPTLAYPARGVADLWTPSAPEPPGGVLAALVGPARARVLGRLAVPHTTTELADALRVSPATASQHLTALQRAGVVDRMRVGRRVYYALSDRGRAVLAALVEAT